MSKIFSSNPQIPQNISQDIAEIISDEEEMNEESLIMPRGDFSFKGYGEALAKIIMDSDPRYSIGIYGDWGFGKTTLMKLIENEIKKKQPQDFKFNWNDIPKNEKSSNDLKFFLREVYPNELNWLNKQEFIKSSDKKTIQVSYKQGNSVNSVSITLKKEKKEEEEDRGDFKEASLKINSNENSAFTFLAGWDHSNNLVIKTSRILTV